MALTLSTKKSYSLVILILLLISPTLTTIEPVAANVDSMPLFDEVSSICAVGVPGPLLALNMGVVPIVAGDEDTEPAISTVAVSSNLVNGRVVALGHEGFLTNDATLLYDNLRFGDNVVQWLDKQGKKKILVTIGHSEWLGGDNFDSFKLELESNGYTVTRFAGVLSTLTLQDVGVVIIGNAWGAFTEKEVLALTDFVSSGGGLMMMGLGWSWEPYHPGSTLDDYPMNIIGEKFGIRWIDGYISDPTNNYKGQPIFHTFYPNIETQTIYQAFDCIATITSDHQSDLPNVLQIDSSIRSRYVKANMLLSTMTVELSPISVQLDEIYSFYREYVNDYPQYFKKSIVYEVGSQSTIAWVRERIYRNILNAILNGNKLDSDKIIEIALTLGLVGKYADIWNDYSVLLLDNSRLDEAQKSVIYDYLSRIPKTLHNLRSISVVDYLGSLPTPTPEINLWGLEGGVNIFGMRVGSMSENGFPDDVTPRYSDVFTLVLAHEVNHVVDAYLYNHDLSLRDRKNALIDRAGSEHLNYLRSMFEDGFFVLYPQEFFASISNQWFSDSALTLKLALTRFDDGYKEPLNQFLFFADVYSLKGNFTQFYTFDALGKTEKQTVPVLRDELGCISEIVYDSTHYKFDLNQDGLVISYTSEPFKNTVIVNKVTVSKQRCDVGSVQTLEYHARWLFGGNDVEGVTLQINGVDYDTNQTGWVSLKVMQDSPKKIDYRITGVSYPKYSIAVSPVSVIWDRVHINFDSQRVNVGSINGAKYSGWYESNNESFQGSVTLNDTLTSQIIGKQVFKAVMINDGKYGLSVFEANSFQVIFDEISIVESGVSSNSLEVNQPVTIWYKALYAYDNEMFDGSKGSLSVNGEPLVWSSSNQRWEKVFTANEAKKQSYKVSNFTDTKYGLTAMNEVTEPITVEWTRSGIPGFSIVAIMIGILFSITVIIFKKDR